MIATPKEVNGRGHNSADPVSTSGAEQSATERTAAHGDATPGSEPEQGKQSEGAPPWQSLVRDVELLRELFSHYSAARADLVRARVRGVVVKAVALLVAVGVMATVLITAVVLTLSGLARALGAAAGDRLWVGQLGVGGGILLLVVAAGVVMAKVSARRNLELLKEKYEHRRESQRQRFGSDNACRDGQLPN
jgi:hypothetical protein